MNFAKAVTETFRELFTLRDPNNTFTNKVSRPKLKKMIGVYAGAVGAKPQKQIVEMAPNAGKPKLQPTLKPAVKPVAPPKLRPVKVNSRLKKAAVREASELEGNATEPFIEEPNKTWNKVLPKTDDNLKELRLRTTRKTTHKTVSPKRRQFLFLNVGDESILRFINGERPPWTNLFQNELSMVQNRAYFEGLPILLRDERRNLVKKTYFDPGAPTSVYNIHEYLSSRAANITRREVARILNTLEVYQRMRSRQLPHKITGRVETTSPGFLAADTIYPSEKHGWPRGTVIFTIVDMWSRYSGAYLLSDKQKGTVAKAFKAYLEGFRRLSTVPPRLLMLDKGSELKGLDEVMEQHSRKRPCVFRSLTGQPVNIIEGYNAQLQRMCQVYREAGIVSRFDDILYLVVNAINNQARKDRMGYTPVELLQMGKAMRQEVNANYKFRNVMSAEKDPLQVGHYVRVLNLNRKEQVDAKTKGFPAHWSKDVYQVVKRISVVKNPGVYKYFVTSTTTGERLEGSRFRHELLKLRIQSPNDIDTNIPRVRLKQVDPKLYRVEGAGGEALYDPAEEGFDLD